MKMLRHEIALWFLYYSGEVTNYGDVGNTLYLQLEQVSAMHS